MYRYDKAGDAKLRRIEAAAYRKSERVALEKLMARLRQDASSRTRLSTALNDAGSYARYHAKTEYALRIHLCASTLATQALCKRNGFKLATPLERRVAYATTRQIALERFLHGKAAMHAEPLKNLRLLFGSNASAFLKLYELETQLIALKISGAISPAERQARACRN
ncbi:MAG: hypothetical protein AABW54_00905 [Candidatus Micrarchaeota archaeon]